MAWTIAGPVTGSYAGRMDGHLLQLYVEYVLECIAAGVSPLPPAEFRALILEMLSGNAGEESIRLAEALQRRGSVRAESAVGRKRPLVDGRYRPGADG